MSETPPTTRDLARRLDAVVSSCQDIDAALTELGDRVGRLEAALDRAMADPRVQAFLEQPAATTAGGLLSLFFDDEDT